MGVMKMQTGFLGGKTYLGRCRKLMMTRKYWIIDLKRQTGFCDGKSYLGRCRDPYDDCQLENMDRVSRQ